jgi:hypothetical protein
MNGQHLLWFKYHGKWCCNLRETFGHTYSGASDWLANAEAMLKDPARHVLWRLQDEQARRLVWC